MSEWLDRFQLGQAYRARIWVRGAQWSAAVGAVLTPWLLLLVRAALAQGFLRTQVMQLMLPSRLQAPLGSQWWLQAAHHIAGSGFGTAIQALCPLLLLVGLLARPAALAMLLQVVLLPPAGMSHPLDIVWAALLVFAALHGPGALSLDRLLARGVAASPIPFARALAAACRFASHRIEPVALTGLRVLAAFGAAPGLMLAGRLRQIDSLPTMLPHPLLWLLAAALAAGLFTRAAALVLLSAAPFMAETPNQRLFWALLLLVLVIRGGGAASLDALFQLMARRTRSAPSPEHLPHVVVLGAGFGGVAVARGLARAPCRVTLIDRTNYTLFQPLLYQVATAGLSPAEIATPIRSLFRGRADVAVLLAEVTGIDPAQHQVRLGDVMIGYDQLVVATGARPAYFGHDAWATDAPGLKSIEDATDIRRRLLLAFERAEGAADAAERAAWLTFVVVGGGPTGVELAGAISELARVGMTGEFRNVDPATARIILVQSAARVLPGFPASLSAAALASLRERGVEVLLDCKLTSVTGHAAVLSGSIVPTRTVIWAAGVAASPAAQWLGVAPDRAGRVEVGADLTVPGWPDIFVIGDTAASLAWNGAPVPGLAPAAKQGGAYAARVITARLLHQPKPPPFRYRHFGSLATIGRDSAVAEFGALRLHGALAWWVWGLAHIAFLADARSRVAVMANWIWAYLTFRRSTRLITFPPATPGV
jgi:NADH dehydrogenase/putative oxidoreductase